MKTNQLVNMAFILLASLFCANAMAQEPIWDPNKVIFITKKLGENVYGVFPTEAFEAPSSKAKATTGGFIVGKNSVLVIESFLNADLASQMINQVRQVTQLPIKYLVNTSYHGDHSYGNYVFPASTTIIQHKEAKKYVDNYFVDDTKFMIQNFGLGRGIERVIPRAGDLLIDSPITLDLGGVEVEILTFGFGQTPGDLYVWEPKSKVLFVGNVIVAAPPAIPWLLDGRHEEVLSTLKKIKSFLPDDAIIVPGHHAPMKKTDMDFVINYLTALHTGVESGIKKGFTIEKVVETLKMDEFNKGYNLYGWLHFQLNIPKTYNELKNVKK